MVSRGRSKQLDGLRRQVEREIDRQADKLPKKQAGKQVHKQEQEVEPGKQEKSPNGIKCHFTCRMLGYLFVYLPVCLGTIS